MSNAYGDDGYSYGLPQFICTDWAKAGALAVCDPAGQVEAAISYMQARYGPAVKGKCTCVHQGFKCGNEAVGNSNMCAFCASGACPGNQ